MCLMPHSRHVLSDAPSCMKFLADHEGEPFDVALSPAAMMEPRMLAAAEDHAIRLFQMLGGSCSMVLLGDVTASEDRERCVEVPPGEGRLGREQLRRLVEEHVPAQTAVVIDARLGAEAISWLTGAFETGGTCPGPPDRLK